MSDKKYNIIETKPGISSTIEIQAAVDWKVYHEYYERRLDKIVEHLELDGFRKGKAPRERVEQEVGQMEVLQQASQDVLGDVYPAMVLEQELQVIGYPQIAISKIAYGSDLEFTATTAVMPEFDLPDYRHIAQDINKEEIVVEVSDDEVNEAVERIRTMYAHSIASPESGEKGDQESEQDLPELTDEFVAKLGDYTSVEEFHTKFREDMRERKHTEEVAKRREEIVKTIAEKVPLDLPEVLIDSEKDSMLAAIKDDIARMGLEYEKWLEHSGKSEEEMRTDMHEDAIARAHANLVLKAIAHAENISPEEAKISQQLAAISEVHPDVSPEQIRAYVENIYLNEAVLQFLDEQK